MLPTEKMAGLGSGLQNMHGVCVHMRVLHCVVRACMHACMVVCSY